MRQGREERAGPASVETQETRTLLEDPFSAPHSSSARAAFAPTPPDRSHESEPGVLRPRTLSRPNSGAHTERPQPSSFLLPRDPFQEGALSLRAMFLFPPSLWLRLPGSFNKRLSSYSRGSSLGAGVAERDRLRRRGTFTHRRAGAINWLQGLVASRLHLQLQSLSLLL